MQIKVDRDLKVPVYLQIRNQIASMILDGTLRAGQPLPPERTLAQSLGINRSTVVNAYSELKADGLVDSRVGKGTVVLSHLTGEQDKEKYSDPPAWSQFLSHTAERSNESLLRDILELANRRDIISFAAGISGMETDPVEALRGIEEEIVSPACRFALNHTPAEGMPCLRESISELMCARGVEAGPEEILVLSGSQQGIDIAARAFLDPGDVVFVEEPTFFSALQIFRAAGARIIGIPVDARGMRVDLLEQALTRYRPKFIFTVPTFQNPSGTTMDLERRKRLLELAYRRNTFILEDDPYSDLRFEGSRVPLLKELDKNGYVIYLSSFSKLLFPGVRIGWINAPKPMVVQFTKVKQMTDLHADSLSQWIIHRYLRSGGLDAHLSRIIAEYRIKRDIMIDELITDPVREMEWNKPQGGFYLWCRLPDDIPYATLMVKAAERGVAYVSGTAFFQGGKGGNYMRLNFTYPSREEIREGIRRLKAAIRETLQAGERNRTQRERKFGEFEVLR
ncbi:PLP-dependent aminotransferase family protein [Papillibacter cinnamivorans]|uniref:DNA-binding transcriptional regulator, MocR family, contains an aminotransferase domain n=1 Tax=Papillibacter cinnamivorans DSM 12816 TaxID=1122930 RepID=A0A1W2CY02_9FIRM|nr:PLP-dependent aminotransferase family protein [Papillibacter cinnamivorans]SMC90040.1 DNA-binding transcriptional regulator, MocR family, contains an aminotransferase domain [Papillibacter cinnamivorans DSM 12816]